jgi:glycosyltransferase involved in cell wall biosynthesis
MQVNLYSPIGYTGYGVAGLNFVKFLSEKVDLCLFPIGQINAETHDDSALCLTTAGKQDNYDPKAPCVKIWHQFDMAARIGSGKFYAYPFFELDKLSKKEIHHLSCADEIIVPCQWAKDVLINNGISQHINIVPLGVNRAVFDNTIKSSMKPTNKYIFMNIGKWEVRKGHDILVDLFNKTFTENDDVELWIEASSSEYAFAKEEIEYWHKLYMTSKLKDKIKIFPRLNTQVEIAQLMSYADCGIFPSRAEGWNLELLEMMAMNKPVITTNYSAHTEYCNKDNAYLVDVPDVELAKDNKYFFGQGNWAKLGQSQLDSFCDYMRYVYTNKISSNDDGVKTADRFNWVNAADTLIRCIS